MDPEKILAAWYEFINRENILPDLSPLVANSWRRCWARINPTQKLQFNKLNTETMLAAQVASFELISIARPILEDIYQNINHSDVAILLLNGTGYILDILAEPDMRRWLEEAGIGEGVLFTETHVGTNALGLALTERMPVEIIGPEHYCQQLHPLADAAAPIFDITGRPLGACGLISPLNSYHSHSLGMMTAAAKGIEAQRQADVLLAEQNSQLAQLNVIMDTISEGIVVWNGERTLIHVNNYAARLIDLPMQALVGQSIGSLLNIPHFIQKAIERQEPLTDVEANIKIGGKTISCVISLRFVVNKNELQWIITTFRPIKEVRQLVQQQVGAQAQMSLDDIPGDSSQMKRVHHFVKSTAPAKASILIRGESGTGKNVLARAIHHESPRRDGPFLIFPCASVPGELVLSELIGYEEGAFPQKAGSRPSKFELAQGGTIFFQDVEALSLEAQAVLLNVLELGVIQRLGSDRPAEVDVRVIASTSAKMENHIAEGSFRADLFYRLSTFTITLPSLRERQQDIPFMAYRILNRLSRQMEHTIEFGPGVLETMKHYPWPGNIREMEAVLGSVVSHLGPASGNSPQMIELDNLPPAIRFLKHLPDDATNIDAIHSMTEIEREAILQTAKLCRGNITQMAEILGFGRTTLWRKIKRYHIQLDEYRKPVAG